MRLVDAICGLVALGPWCAVAISYPYPGLAPEWAPEPGGVVAVGFPAVLIATPLNLWYGGWLRRRVAKRTGVVGALLWLASFAGAVGSVVALLHLGPSWVLRRMWLHPDWLR